MAHQEPINIANENRRLGDLGNALSGVSFLVGVVALLAAIVLGYFSGPYGDSSQNGGLGTGLVRLQYAYLLGFIFFLTITLGGLFFTITLYLMGAKWGIVVRRIPELAARNAPVLAILILPIIIPMLFGSYDLYEWADQNKYSGDAITRTKADQHIEEVRQSDAHPMEKYLSVYQDLIHHKAPWLNVKFFTIRIVIYFLIWAGLGWYFYSRSVKSWCCGLPSKIRSARFRARAACSSAAWKKFPSPRRASPSRCSAALRWRRPPRSTRWSVPRRGTIRPHLVTSSRPPIRTRARLSSPSVSIPREASIRERPLSR